MTTIRIAINGTVSAGLLLFILTGCLGSELHVQGYDCSELAKTYFRKSLKDTMTDFGGFEVEKQYAIYICGNQYIHPSAIHLAEPFAREGEKVVGFLKARLQEASDDFTVRDIVLVFTEMSRQKTYDVVGDNDLIRILRKKVASMKDLDWQQLSEKNLNEISK